MANGQKLRRWLDSIGGDGWVWFAKRLSANDTGQTGAHQVGFYLRKSTAFEVAPEVAARAKTDLNPDKAFRLRLISHDQQSEPRLIYYNNAVVNGGTRDECRITRFGGTGSVLQQKGSTGKLLLLAFRRGTDQVEGWLATSREEERIIEAGVEQVLGERLTETLGFATIPVPTINDIPAAWKTKFPSGEDLATTAINRIVKDGLPPDTRLVRRLDYETTLFGLVEGHHALPLIGQGFKTMEEFTELALSLMNRRKSRRGGSLQRHLGVIFDEEGVAYTPNPKTEGRRRPDFIFPSIEKYRAAPNPAPDVHMMAAKTTLKERWQEVPGEAEKIPTKHLFTLERAIPVPQFEEMTRNRLIVVVPTEYIADHKATVQPQLWHLQRFIDLVRPLQP